MDQIHIQGFGFYSGYGSNIPCKVSVINEQGLVILDTLVRPCVNGKDASDISQIKGHRSLWGIHGIKREWLEDAPSFDSVREHILELAGLLSPKQDS